MADQIRTGRLSPNDPNASFGTTACAFECAASIGSAVFVACWIVPFVSLIGGCVGVNGGHTQLNRSQLRLWNVIYSLHLIVAMAGLIVIATVYYPAHPYVLPASIIAHHTFTGRD